MIFRKKYALCLPLMAAFCIMCLLSLSACDGQGRLNTVESIYNNMVPITGGSFDMGCSDGDSECDESEIPQHAVTLSSFKISAYEITQGQWKAVMGDNPSEIKTCGTDCPVDAVSWDDVQDFIDALNNKTSLRYRLPTEAEWEYAARAGTSTKYYCGNDESCLDTIAWYQGSADAQPHPVGLKAPNAWGLYDTSGNVWEFVSDWYDEDYYADSPAADPPGPSSGPGRIRRGGGWYYNAYSCRVSKRSYSYQENPGAGEGFRLVLP